MKTEELTPAEYRAKYLTRHTRGRATRPDIPSAPRSERTGLTSLILRGWSVESRDSVGYRLYVINDPARDTGWQPSERAACDRAKELER